MKNLLKTGKRSIAAILTLCIIIGIAGTCVYAAAVTPEENTAVIEETTVVAVETTQELVPVMANACDGDTDDDYYSQNYPIFSSLQGCPGFVSGFISYGAAFYVSMTNLELQSYFQQVSPGTWKKGYQNGYYEGIRVSIHYFKNMTSGSAYSGYKLVSGWVQ